MSPVPTPEGDREPTFTVDDMFGAGAETAIAKEERDRLREQVGWLSEACRLTVADAAIVRDQRGRLHRDAAAARQKLQDLIGGDWTVEPSLTDLATYAARFWGDDRKELERLRADRARLSGGNTTPKNAAGLVLEFHRAFDLPVGDASRTYNKLRADLIREEAKEAADALEDLGLVEQAKELADLVYVAYGAAVTLGIDLDHAVRLVHAANMSKLVDGKPVMREDGKVLKGPNYAAPDMAPAVGWGSAVATPDDTPAGDGLDETPLGILATSVPRKYVPATTCERCGGSNLQGQPFSGGEEVYCPDCDEVFSVRPASPAGDAALPEDREAREDAEDWAHHATWIPKLADTEPSLIAALRRLGDDFGPLGVALTAAQLTDPQALIARIGTTEAAPTAQPKEA